MSGAYRNMFWNPRKSTEKTSAFAHLRSADDTTWGGERRCGGGQVWRGEVWGGMEGVERVEGGRRGAG